MYQTNRCVLSLLYETTHNTVLYGTYKVGCIRFYTMYCIDQHMKIITIKENLTDLNIRLVALLFPCPIANDFEYLISKTMHYWPHTIRPFSHRQVNVLRTQVTFVNLSHRLIRNVSPDIRCKSGHRFHYLQKEHLSFFNYERIC